MRTRQLRFDRRDDRGRRDGQHGPGRWDDPGGPFRLTAPGASRWRRSLRRAALALLIGSASAAGAAPVLPAVPAQAAPACSNGAVQPGQPVTDKPWAQQRYDLDRLTGLADGAGQVIAVVDSGVNATHPQLKDAVLAGVDAIDAGGNGQTDCVGHGTAVASIIAARGAGGIGFRGVAPAASIFPIRAAETQKIEGKTSGKGVDMGGLAGVINRAVDARASVINLSVASTEDHPAVRQAVANAIARNVVVVAAVGNDHSSGDPTPYPAAYPGVLGVGAIGPDGMRVAESQVGYYVDLVAPGGQVTAALPGGGHVATYQGTSFAAPFAAGAAALVRQYYPALSPAEVIARLVATADPAPGGVRSNEYGAGILNPYRAVTEHVGGSPSRLAPLPPRGSENGGAAARRAARTRAWALGIAVVVGTLAVVIVLAATILPRGRRRRWHPGLQHTTPPIGTEPSS